jgi:carbon-monoxide dehydrogenase small subunit
MYGPLDGKAMRSCLLLAMKAKGREIVTIEGLKGKEGELHPLQRAFIDHFAVQCGYCTPGMILVAKALLDENPTPTEEQVKEGLRGNMCRCTGYTKIIEAVLAAADKMKRTRSQR